MSKKEIKHTFYELLISVKNAIESLFKLVPGLLYGGILLLFFVMTYLPFSEAKMIILLSVIVSMTSLFAYFQIKSYSQTMLSFLIGLLTIFTITWTTVNSIIFIVFYLGFNIIIFMSASIRSSAEMENILVQATNFIDRRNKEVTHKQLADIINQGTDYRQLGPIERANIIRFLAFRKIPLETMASAISIIEMIKVVCQTSVEAACQFFYSLYLVSLHMNGETEAIETVGVLLDVVIKLPLLPDESFCIFNRTKTLLINRKLTIEEYFEQLTTLVQSGFDHEEIIHKLLST